MLNIHFKGIITEIDNLEKRTVNNATIFKEPNTLKDIMKRSAIHSFFILVSSLLLTIYVFLDVADVNNKKILVGLISSSISAIFIPIIHEMIHALFYPKESDKEIWVTKTGSSMFVYCTASVSKNRFIIICYAPFFFLGFLPMFFALFGYRYLPVCLTSYLLMIGLFSVITGIGDYYNSMLANTQVPKEGKVYNSGAHTYWYCTEDKNTFSKTNSIIIYLILLNSVALVFLNSYTEISITFAFFSVLLSSLHNGYLYKIFGTIGVLILFISCVLNFV